MEWQDDGESLWLALGFDDEPSEGVDGRLDLNENGGDESPPASQRIEGSLYTLPTTEGVFHADHAYEHEPGLEHSESTDKAPRKPQDAILPVGSWDDQLWPSHDSWTDVWYQSPYSRWNYDENATSYSPALYELEGLDDIVSTERAEGSTAQTALHHLRPSYAEPWSFYTLSDRASRHRTVEPQDCIIFDDFSLVANETSVLDDRDGAVVRRSASECAEADWATVNMMSTEPEIPVYHCRTPECDRVFTRKATRRKHEKKNHRGLPSDLISEVRSPRDQTNVGARPLPASDTAEPLSTGEPTSTSTSGLKQVVRRAQDVPKDLPAFISWAENAHLIPISDMQDPRYERPMIVRPLEQTEATKHEVGRAIDHEDASDQASEYSYVSSVFSDRSRATEDTEISTARRFTALHVETATRELLRVFQEHHILVPLYQIALDQLKIGPDRLQRNLYRLLKIYARNLQEEAAVDLETKASELVSLKARYVAQSVVEDFHIRPVVRQPKTLKDQESSDEDDAPDEQQLDPVDEDLFENLTTLRKFLVESEAFRTFQEQLAAFIRPKPINTYVFKQKKENWFQRNMKAVLITVGYLEPPLEPGMTRIRWQCVSLSC